MLASRYTETDFYPRFPDCFHSRYISSFSSVVSQSIVGSKIIGNGFNLFYCYRAQWPTSIDRQRSVLPSCSQISLLVMTWNYYHCASEILPINHSSCCGDVIPFAISILSWLQTFFSTMPKYGVQATMHGNLSSEILNLLLRSVTPYYQSVYNASYDPFLASILLTSEKGPGGYL